MHTTLGTHRADRTTRGAVDRDRLIQATAIVFTLAVALACTGKGSSGSSGHKKKKDRDPPPFAATLATDDGDARASEIDSAPRVEVPSPEASEPAVRVTFRRDRGSDRAGRRVRDRGR